MRQSIQSFALLGFGILISAQSTFPSFAQAVHPDAQPIARIQPVRNAITDAIETAKIYFQRAGTKAKAGDNRGAVEDYSRVIQLVPDYDKPYLFRGNLRESMGDKIGALADYGQAIEINPENLFAYYNRAVVLASMKNYEGAIADYTQTIRLQPAFVAAYKNRGFSYLALNQLSDAIQDLQTAAQLYQKEGNKEGYQQIQQVLKEIDQS